MPYAVIEKMYSSLSLKKQKETVKDIHNSYHEGFFNLFGCCDDDSFVEPEDMVAVDCEDDLF